MTRVQAFRQMYLNTVVRYVKECFADFDIELSTLNCLEYNEFINTALACIQTTFCDPFDEDMDIAHTDLIRELSNLSRMKHGAKTSCIHFAA